MKLTIGMTLNLLLAAEMEVPVARVADRPAAIAWQKREDRLPLLQRNNQVVMSERSGWSLSCKHKTSYTTTRCASQEFASHGKVSACCLGKRTSARSTRSDRPKSQWRTCGHSAGDRRTPIFSWGFPLPARTLTRGCSPYRRERRPPAKIRRAPHSLCLCADQPRLRMRPAGSETAFLSGLQLSPASQEP